MIEPGSGISSYQKSHRSSPPQDYDGSDVGDVGVIIKGRVYPYIEKNPLDLISLTGFALGGTVGLSIGLLPCSFFKNFNIYLVAVSVFHFLEFYTTAKYNPGKVTSDSFLFNNGKAYAFSFVFAVSEALLESLFFGWKTSFPTWYHTSAAILGLILMFLGQYIRTSAMITAGRSFSHQVKTSQNPDHVLITTGIYAHLRHPSYFGYFWWALGTQLWLLNPVSFAVFAYVLWRFFHSRIQYEERYLNDFFGEEYTKYTQRVAVGIPFIN
ncbi:LAQU0S14e00496g1_1 [Lachancea quebecensis]|uniref:Protein-S-isoprenylcysteine O-methyltransferase n=1 Tax=Lachancea quebecensis TaxID=1654605 RepID=A0A0P1KXI0_9SACH|nr:LAQU0S14e00496g1_1 [Lachancea quebecensis]